MTKEHLLVIVFFLLALIILFLNPLPALPYNQAKLPRNLCFRNCVADSRGIELIQYFEGYSPFIYKDAVGIPTIGFGHVIKPGENFIEPLMGDDALNLLENDVMKTAKVINPIINVPLKSGQFDALTSFSFNLGSGTLRKSTLLKYVNSGRNDQVPAQFNRYVYAGGIKLTGIVIRRKLEARLYTE